MRSKITIFAVAALVLPLSISAEAQQTAKIPRVGFLSGRAAPTSATPDPYAEAFRQGLRDLGYVEGKNILLELRYSEGKQEVVAKPVAQLVQEKIDVLISGYFPLLVLRSMRLQHTR